MSLASPANWSRRDVLRGFAAAFATALAGCTPMRIIAGDYPVEFKRNDDVNDRVLRAFVATVIPGIPIDQPDLARAFRDEFFPFAKYRGFFASDLCDRARRLYRNSAFEVLNLAQRTRVVQDGLHADAITQRLYRGAITLAQAATYGGIYGKSGDVPLIEYQGFRFEYNGPEAFTYPDPQRFMATALTRNGNPA